MNFTNFEFEMSVINLKMSNDSYILKLKGYFRSLSELLLSTYRLYTFKIYT